MSSLRDWLAFLSLATLWGLTVPAVEIGLTSFPPLLLSAFRFYIGGVILLGYVGMMSNELWPTTRADIVAIMGGGVLWIGVGNGVWYVGQQLTTSVLSGFMTSLVPITTVAFSWFALPRDRLTLVSLVGLLVSFGGALLVVAPTTNGTLAPRLLGTGLLVVGVLGLAAGTVVIRWASSSLPSTVQSAWSTLLGAGLIHLFSVLSGEQWDSAVTIAGIGALAYLGFLGTVLAYILFFSLLARRSAIEVSLVTYLVPVVAVTAGWVLFNDPITARMIVGFLIVLLGFAFMKQRELRAEFFSDSNVE